MDGETLTCRSVRGRSGESTGISRLHRGLRGWDEVPTTGSFLVGGPGVLRTRRGVSFVECSRDPLAGDQTCDGPVTNLRDLVLMSRNPRPSLKWCRVFQQILRTSLVLGGVCVCPGSPWVGVDGLPFLRVRDHGSWYPRGTWGTRDGTSFYRRLLPDPPP